MSPPADRTRGARRKRPRADDPGHGDALLGPGADEPAGDPDWFGEPDDLDDMGEWWDGDPDSFAEPDDLDAADEWRNGAPARDSAAVNGPTQAPSARRRVLDDPPGNPLHAPADGPIRDAFGDARVAEIREFGRLIGLPLRAQRRDDLLDQLVAGYRDPAVLQGLVARLRESDRHLLGLIAWVGPACVKEILDAVAFLAPRLPVSWRVGDVGQRELDHLVQCGVLLADPRLGGGCFCVPAQVASTVLPIAELVPSVSLPHGSRTRDCDPVGAVARAGLALQAHGPIEIGLPGSLQPSVSSVLRAWEMQRSLSARTHHATTTIPPAASPLSASARKALSALLPPDAVDFHIALLASLGILEPADQHGEHGPRREFRRVAVEPRRLAQFLGHGLEDQFALLIDGWLRCRPWMYDELLTPRADAAACKVARRAMDLQFTWQDYERDVSIRRRHALTMVRRLPGDVTADSGWVDARAFVDRAAGARPSSVAPLQPGARWFLLDRDGSQLVPGESSGWNQVADNVLASVLTGPLHWLGLVEVATRPRGELVALRLTPIGRALRDGRAIERASGERLAWSGDRVTVSGSIGPATAALCRYCRCEHVAAQALQFRFHRELAEAAFDSGRILHDVLADLARAGVVPPSDVQERLRSWWARWGTINRYELMTVVECAEEATLRELLLDREFRQMVLCLLGPGVVAIAPDDSSRVLELLRSAGHTPKVVNHAPPRPSSGALP